MKKKTKSITKIPNFLERSFKKPKEITLELAKKMLDDPDFAVEFAVQQIFEGGFNNVDSLSSEYIAETEVLNHI
jgi:hypothetical protein